MPAGSWQLFPRFKKLAARHLSTLEHGNVIFEVSREMYKNFTDFVRIYETSWTKPVLDHFCNLAAYASRKLAALSRAVFLSDSSVL